MIDIETTTITVNDTVEMLSNTYISTIKSHTPFKRIPSVMLWGPPGVGKSQGVRQIAEKIQEMTDR
jgi:replication-associated recombination protein RarA